MLQVEIRVSPKRVMGPSTYPCPRLGRCFRFRIPSLPLPSKCLQALRGRGWGGAGLLACPRSCRQTRTDAPPRATAVAASPFSGNAARPESAGTPRWKARGPVWRGGANKRQTEQTTLPFFSLSFYYLSLSLSLSPSRSRSRCLGRAARRSGAPGGCNSCVVAAVGPLPPRRPSETLPATASINALQWRSHCA